MRKRYYWKLKAREIILGDRTVLMGVLNVTPDSFSDGGKYLDPERAYARALELEEQGADIVDIGAESTRPGSARITAAEGKALAPHRIHDLRRTVRTRLGKLGVLPHIAELVLNHAGHKSGIGGVYDHHGYGDEIAEALRKWEAHLLTIVG